MSLANGRAGLRVQGLNVGYGGARVIERLTLPELRRGRVVALIGPNAAGKSTLLRAIAGLLPTEGSIQLGEQELLGMHLAQRAEKIGFMPQALPHGIALSVLETMLGALRVSTTGAALDSTRDLQLRAHALLTRLGIEHLALLPLQRLSGGQRQMVSLAQAVIRQPDVLLLDEPTSALDLRHQAQVMGTVRELAEDGRIVIAVLHDLSLAARWADDVMVLNKGRLHCAGTAHQALTAQMLAEVYQVAARVEQCSRGHLHIAVDGPLEQGAGR